MSIGNLKSEGNKGNNFPFQLKVLQGLQCACDQLKAIGADTTAIEQTLLDIEAAIGNLATEVTLAAVNTKLTPTTRTHNTVSATGAGSVPAGSLRGSVLNVGSAVGTWNGISLPAGVAVPWDAVGSRDTYGAIAYDATGTTFIIEYTT